MNSKCWVTDRVKPRPLALLHLLTCFFEFLSAFSNPLEIMPNTYLNTCLTHHQRAIGSNKNSTKQFQKYFSFLLSVIPAWIFAPIHPLLFLLLELSSVKLWKQAKPWQLHTTQSSYTGINHMLQIRSDSFIYLINIFEKNYGLMLNLITGKHFKELWEIHVPHCVTSPLL